jgi:hypothetical protein
VSAAQAVDDALALTVTFDQPREAKFGEVLAGHGGAAAGGLGEGGDVVFGLAQRPQHPRIYEDVDTRGGEDTAETRTSP